MSADQVASATKYWDLIVLWEEALINAELMLVMGKVTGLYAQYFYTSTRLGLGSTCMYTPLAKMKV